MKKENKDIRYTIRFTKSENILIENDVNSLGYKDNHSEYFRRKILRKKGIVVNPNKLIDELYLLRSELNKIGSNLNQVANYSFFAKNKE